jgi:hypothetical protein
MEDDSALDPWPLAQLTLVPLSAQLFAKELLLQSLSWQWDRLREIERHRASIVRQIQATEVEGVPPIAVPPSRVPLSAAAVAVLAVLD